mmetsp:Transcript_38913/g.122598  ORF Transcript_38913/g.122598 Transcript_38913/m.122598 type:complete len:143 (-) Transcript_38913:814-1242(-)
MMREEFPGLVKVLKERQDMLLRDGGGGGARESHLGCPDRHLSSKIRRRGLARTDSAHRHIASPPRQMTFEERRMIRYLKEQDCAQWFSTTTSYPLPPSLVPSPRSLSSQRSLPLLEHSTEQSPLLEPCTGCPKATRPTPCPG